MYYAQLLFPDFSLIVLGWALCRFTALNRSIWDAIDSLVYYCLFPVLLFHSITRSSIDFAATSHLLLGGLGVSFCAIALAYTLPYWPGLGQHLNRPDHAASAQVAFRFNSFICLTMVERLAGPQGTQMMAVLIGACVPILNTAAVWPMARHAEQGFLKQLVRNPLIVATLSGLLVNVLGWQVPVWLAPTLTRIGAASLALGLMAAGAGMQLGLLHRSKALAASVLLIRHLALPLVGIGLVHVLGLTGVQAQTLMVFSAAPTASSAYVLAARMGYNGALVAALVTLSIALAAFSLPFALSLLGAS